jgi:hypothetical protein
LLLSLLNNLPQPGALAVGSALAFTGATETDIRSIVSANGSIKRNPPEPISTNALLRGRSLSRLLGKASRQSADHAIQSITHWLDSNRPNPAVVIEPIHAASRILLSYPGSLSDRIARARRPKPEGSGTGVTLITMHSAKGKEFPKVWLPGLVDGTVPNKRSDDLEEERRLFYVAMTRAEDTLILSFPWEVHTVSLNDVIRISRRAPSRFLTMDLGIELKRSDLGPSGNNFDQRRAS